MKKIILILLIILFSGISFGQTAQNKIERTGWITDKIQTDSTLALDSIAVHRNELDSLHEYKLDATDTASLSNRINTKIAIGDSNSTSAGGYITRTFLLSNHYTQGYLDPVLSGKLNIGDSTAYTAPNYMTWKRTNDYFLRLSGGILTGALEFGAGDFIANKARAYIEGTTLKITTLGAINFILANGTIAIDIRSTGDIRMGTTDGDGTPPIGRLTLKGSTNNGTSNIFVGRDSDEVNQYWWDTNGNLTSLGKGTFRDTLAAFNTYNLFFDANGSSFGGIFIKDDDWTNKVGFIFYGATHISVPNELWIKNYVATGHILLSAAGGSTAAIDIDENNVSNFKKNVTVKTDTLTTTTINALTATKFHPAKLTTNVTYTISNLNDGATVEVYVDTDSTHTVTWTAASSILWQDGVTPTQSISNFSQVVTDKWVFENVRGRIFGYVIQNLY